MVVVQLNGVVIPRYEGSAGLLLCEHLELSQLQKDTFATITVNRNYLHELWVFGYRNALSCIFPASIFLLLALSRILPQGLIPRYDVMLAACLLVQALMVMTKLETRDELLVICLFHVLGLAMELYKVHMGSWSYPEAAWTKIYGVPLYSGFMYPNLASYMCQAWRPRHLRIKHWPPAWTVWTIAAAIYLNFFTHHY